MNDSLVEIVLRIKDETGAVIDKTVSDINALKKATAGAGEGLDTSKMTKGLEESGKAAKNTAQDLGAFQKGLTSAGTAVEGLLGSLRAFGPAIASALALNKLKDLADTSAKVEVTGTVLRVVAANAGISGAAITKLDKEIQALGITAKDSGEALTKYIQAGLAGTANESLGKVKELARAAQDLAVVSGQNSSDTFNRLITNIQQMDTLGLRFMGILVDREVAEEKYAATLGKTAASLTELEKKQALMNAALAEAAKFQGTYEEAMTNAAKQLTSLPRLHAELKESLGNGLLPAYSALIDVYSEFLKSLKKVADATAQSSDGGLRLAQAVRSLAESFAKAGVFLAEHADMIITIASAWAAMKVVGVVAAMLSTALGPLVSLLQVGTAIKGLSLASVFISMGSGVVTLTQALMGSATALTAVRAGLTAMLPLLGPIGLAIGVVAVAWNALAGSKKPIISAEDRADAEKQLDGMVKDFVAAKDTLAKAKDKAASLGLSSEEQAAADKAVKAAAAEESAQRKKIDALAKQYGLSAELIAMKDREAEGELQIAQSMNKVTSELAAMKLARQTLGITDKDGKTEIQKYKDIGDSFEKVFDDSVNAIYRTEESFDQRLNRVLSSGAESAKSIAAKARAAGQDVQTWLENAYPSPDQIGSWTSLSDAISKGGERSARAFDDLSKGFDKFIQQAKSPDEIAVALDRVGRAAGYIGERVLAAKESLRFSAEQAEISRLNTALSGFANGLTVIRGSLTTMSELYKDNAASSAKWKSILLEAGSALNSIGKAAYGAEGSVRIFADATAAMSSASAANTQASVSQAQQKYAQEEALLSASYEKRKGVAAEYNASGKASGAQESALYKELLAGRLANAKQYYTALKQAQSEAMDSFKSYADKVKELDKQIFNTRESKERDLREIRRKGMSEEQANLDKQAEYQELIEKSKAATQQKSYDKAKEYAEQAKALAKNMGLSWEEEATLVGRAWDSIEEAQKGQKTEAVSAMETQRKLVESLTTTMGTLAEQIGKLSAEQVVSVSIDLNQQALEDAMKRVKEAFEGMSINVNVSTSGGGSVPGYATGGLIQGPGTGTSDSILAAVSNLEFISTARAVQHYGADVYHAMNSRLLPRDFLRSLLNGAFPRFNAGGLVGAVAAPASAAVPSMALDLSFNGRSLGRVAGSRDTVHNLVAALKDISRGT